jgi:heptosyltransferase-2
VLVVGTASDASETAAVCRLLPGAVDLAGRTSLGALLALLERAAGVLSNDSGVMHVAAAVGAPVVGVFGSTNPAWTRPLGPRATFLWRGVACSPCYAPRCRLDFACMLDLPPEALVTAMRGVRSRPDVEVSQP